LKRSLKNIRATEESGNWRRGGAPACEAPLAKTEVGSWSFLTKAARLLSSRGSDTVATAN